jgi:hypothetical protein
MGLGTGREATGYQSGRESVPALKRLWVAFSRPILPKTGREFRKLSKEYSSANRLHGERLTADTVIGDFRLGEQLSVAIPYQAV